MTVNLYGQEDAKVEEILDLAAEKLVFIYKIMDHTWTTGEVPNRAEIRKVLQSLWKDIMESMVYAMENDEPDMILESVATGGIIMVPYYNEEGEIEDVKILYEVGSKYKVAHKRGLV